MLKINYYEDETKKRSGYNCCCAAINIDNFEGYTALEQIETRCKTYEEAKKNILKQIKNLRDGLSDLIEREENKIMKTKYMEFNEFKDLVLKLTNGLQEVEYDFDGSLYYESTDKADELETYWEESIPETLSKYFGVAVTSVTADDNDEYPGVLICYEDLKEEYTKIYAVYQNYTNENTPLTSIKFYTDKEQAVQKFNSLKNEYLYNNDWKMSDLFNTEDVTDSDNSIMFTHKASQTDMYVNIETLEVH